MRDTMSRRLALLVCVILGAALVPGGTIHGHANAKLPAVPLNHFYIVVDSATYKAIEKSSFMRKEFAVNETRTTTRTDISYTGLYFYGANTYFEFFDASATAIGNLSDSGIALGVDQAGAFEANKTALAGKFSVGAPITRGFDGTQIPWFYMAVPTKFSMSSGFRFWLMEYHPRFLSEWNPRPALKDQGVSRKQILARYAAVLKDTPSRPYLKDVVALTIALDESTKKDLADLCRSLGYRQTVRGSATILEDEDVELRIVPRTATARGIQEITMRLDRKPSHQTELRFGAKSVLRFRGTGLATWSF